MTSLRALLLAYLLNSLWQVPLFFAAGSLAAFALRRHSPRVLHRLWASTLLMEAVFPALCLRSWPWLDSLARFADLRHRDASTSITITFGPTSSLGQSLSSPLRTALILAYLLTVAYFGLRLLWGGGKVVILRRSATDLTFSPAVLAAWTSSTRHFTIRNAVLAESNKVHTPLTLGLRRKRVLVPPNLLATLAEPELLAVLAHECAHMQRNDFALNLLYELLTLPIAFHPLFRATRSRMVESREWICDEMAAGVLAARENYARSLLRLAKLLLRAAPAPTSHAIGIFDTHALERRLMHLTQKPLQLSSTRRLAGLAACTLIAAATCSSAWAFRTNIFTPAPQSTPAAPHTVRISAGVLASQKASGVNPVYPPEAKAAGIQGSVVLHAIISKEGTIDELTVVSGPEELTGSAVDAVRQWTYKPYLLNGEPTAVETTITVNFQLAN